MRRSRTAWVVGLALSAVALVGLARAAPEGVDLRFSSTGACGSRDELAQKLGVRGVRVASGAVPLDVETTLTAEGATGTFVMGEGDARRSRTLTAESCAAVLEALALAIELAILPENRPPPAAPAPPSPRPDGSVEASGSATAPSPAPSATPPVASPSTSAPVPAPPASGAPAPAPRSSVEAPSAPRVRPVEVAPRFEAAALVAFGGTSGASPVLSPRVQLEAEVARRLGAVLVPTLVVGVGAALPTSTERAGASVAFAAQWAELGLCPVRFGQGRLTARPCLRLDVGRSEAKSEGVAGAKLVGSPFGAVGPTFGGRLRAFGPAFVEASLDALFVFARSEFLFDSSSVYDMPWVRLGARVAVGVSIP